MNYIKRLFFDLKKYKYYILYSVKSNLKAELSNTILGYFWWLLDPLLHMLIYSFVVIVIFQKGDRSFPVHVFCALLPWKAATTTMKMSTTCIRGNAGISKQVYIPSFLHPLIIFMTNTVKLFVGLILLIAMVYIFKMKITWHIIEFIPLYMVFFLFYLSISLILTHLGVVFDDMKNLIGYLILFVFFASPTMWRMDMLPESFKKIIYLNPNVTFFEGMRYIFMYERGLDYKLLGIWFGVSLVLTFFGIVLLYKSEKNYSKAV